MAEYWIDGKKAEDVIAAGEDHLVVQERDWRSGELVFEPDGMPRMMILKGSVMVRATTASEWGKDFSGPVSQPLENCSQCGGSCPGDMCYGCCFVLRPRKTI